MVEYVVLIALVSIVAVFSLGSVGNSIKDKFEDVAINDTTPNPTDPVDNHDDDKIEELIKQGYIIVANPEDLQAVGNGSERIWGVGTKWEQPAAAPAADNNMFAKFIQVCDIDMSDVTDFKPIGTKSHYLFRGIYDGGGFKIKNLTITQPEQNYIGLFTSVGKAIIENINFENANIKGKKYVGALAGDTRGTTITNTSVTGTISGDKSVGGLIGSLNEFSTIANTHGNVNVTSGTWAGGLVGLSTDSSKVERSYTSGTVTANQEVAGGLIGFIRGATVYDSQSASNVKGAMHSGGLIGQAQTSTIRNTSATGTVNGAGQTGGLIGSAIYTTTSDSYATGNVTGKNQFIGGLIGSNYGSVIDKSYATGDATGPQQVGGLVGINQFRATTKNSYATGNASATTHSTDKKYIGGLVGHNSQSSTIIDTYSTGTATGDYGIGGLVGYNDTGSSITNSYTTATANGKSQVGGLIGMQTLSTTVNSYYDIDVTGRSNSADGIGKTTSEMKQRSTYQNWDFDTIWEIKDGKYPTFKWQN